MSYGSPQPRAQSGKGGIFFIMLLVVGAMIFFSRQGAKRTPNQGQSPEEVLGNRDHEHEQLQKDIFGDGVFDPNDQPSQRMPTENQARRSNNNDWDMEDVATQRDQKNSSPGKANSRTTNNDWAMEDVDSEKKKNNQFKFSNDGKKLDSATESGNDWSIEDANKTKKTENGDWAMEETSTKKGK